MPYFKKDFKIDKSFQKTMSFHEKMSVLRTGQFSIKWFDQY